ncbi:MAG: hypothetical protein NTY19_21550 [Planctomycetota bacterium]|nr:hypothetical protein [Planctomycetota bacterium]
MSPQMTSTAWNQGAKNALLCAVGFLLAWLSLAVVFLLATGQSLSASFALAFAVLWCLIFLAFVWTWLYGRRSAGRVLLDCGPHPTRKLFLFHAVLFLLLGLTGGFSVSSVSKLLGIAGPVFGVSFAAYWLIMATGRLQVRENGLWQYYGLLRWNKIASYRWAEDATLLVRSKGSSAWFHGALPVPPEHRQAVEELLSKHCSTQPTA